MNVLFEGKTVTGKDEWLTPPELITTLGEFDLDPCSPIIRPWETAKKYYTKQDNGLIQPWFGRVWCNPPYDFVGEFLDKCAKHGNAIALTFSRCQTEWFDRTIWKKADAIFFMKGKISFYHSNGLKADSAGCGSVLVAYGKNNVEILENTSIRGKFILLK